MSGPDINSIIRAVDRRLFLAEEIFAELRSSTSDGAGVTRPSYGVGEQVGHDLMRKAGERIGLEVTTDSIGNLYATCPGSDRTAPRWLTGSHFDSVRCGGNFDGAAGVVASLVAVAVLKDIGIKLRQDVSAMAIRAEECSSWFSGRHGGHLGSRAALGLLASSELDTAMHVSTGASLAQCINAAGFQSEAVRNGPPPLSKASVRGFIELHIEQGPVLAAEDAAIGIVSSIRGTLRVRDGSCIGAYSHSGAVPQHMRRDAVLATAEFINRVERYCEQLRSTGRDVVFAVGRIHTDSSVDALTKVPGEVRFTVDLRSQESDVLSVICAEMDGLAVGIGSRRNVQFEFGGRTIAEPTIMDANFRRSLSQSAGSLGLRVLHVACGAGHDAAEFVRAGIPSCIIFVRNTGESHNPDEHMEMTDFRSGALLLTHFLIKNAE